MPILGISLNLVNAKKNIEAPSGEIKINSSPRILSVEETELKPLENKVLKIGFEFITTYSEAAEIKLAGDMLFMHDKHKEILDHWKNAKVLSQDVAVEVFNALFAKCLLKSSILAEELQLPLPLNLPKVQPGTGAPDESKQESKKK